MIWRKYPTSYFTLKQIPNKQNILKWVFGFFFFFFLQKSLINELKEKREKFKKIGSEWGSLKVKVKPLSRIQFFATPRTVTYEALPSMGFSRQKYWNGLPFPSPGDLPNSGIEPTSHSLQADALPSELPRKPKKRQIIQKLKKKKIQNYKILS